MGSPFTGWLRPRDVRSASDMGDMVCDSQQQRDPRGGDPRRSSPGVLAEDEEEEEMHLLLAQLIGKEDREQYDLHKLEDRQEEDRQEDEYGQEDDLLEEDRQEDEDRQHELPIICDEDRHAGMGYLLKQTWTFLERRRKVPTPPPYPPPAWLTKGRTRGGLSKCHVCGNRSWANRLKKCMFARCSRNLRWVDRQCKQRAHRPAVGK